jgi:pimeloyl-ACP methyl ester carboxylesterase
LNLKLLVIPFLYLQVLFSLNILGSEIILSDFNYKIQGPSHGHKVVLVHGISDNLTTWKDIGKSLSQSGHRVLSYDQRAHGKSKIVYGKSLSLNDYAADLKELLDQLGWSNITLVGHSWGGLVSMRFASQYPSYIKRLFIEDIGPEISSRKLNFSLRFLKNLNLKSSQCLY